MKTLYYLLMISGLILLGCQSTHEHDTSNINNEEIPPIAVTQWTNKMELFMEYETPIVNQDRKFIIHLTTLSDFQPVRDGKVKLIFKQSDNIEIVVEKMELLREGIFTPTGMFKSSGEYDFSIQYEGEKENELFQIGKFTVYNDIEEIPTENQVEADEEITFLKEQQWKIDFATIEAQRQEMKSSIQTVGEVLPRGASNTEIISPVEGIVSIAQRHKLVQPGQKVIKGQTIVVIDPPMNVQNSWVETYHNYEKAKSEYERSKRLMERSAISEKEYEQAYRNYEMHKAGFSNYFGADSENINYDSENHKFIITSPISGVVSDLAINTGQKINRNQKLLRIINPSKVWLQFELFPSQASNLTGISGASIDIPGKKDKIEISSSQLKFLSKGEIIDQEKRTIKLLLEIDNYNKQFYIGQRFSAQLYTGQIQDVLAIPVSAVYEDNSQKIAFVHITGEAFEKRELTTGSRYHDNIAVLNGLKAGERVVNRGGYQVKLASTSEEIGHPHAH